MSIINYVGVASVALFHSIVQYWNEIDDLVFQAMIRE